MASNGLSLVGFMDQPQALAHLRFACKPASETVSDAELIKEWNAAQAKLGALNPNAGSPKIEDLPASHASYATSFLQEPWIQLSLKQFPGIEVKLIEIAPLLAYQFSVDTERSHQHCNALAQPPALDELLKVCLPTALPQFQFASSPVNTNSQSVVVTTPNHNLQSVQHGIFDITFDGVPAKVSGVRFNETLPFVHVVQFNGKCFLHNGYHRVYGSRMAGATSVPCLFRNVASYEEAGVRSDGTTFAPTIFGSGNPPTLAHFTQGRAFEVKLRRFSRIIHVSWAQHSMPAE